MDRKILIVDDDVNNIEIISGFLKLGENSKHGLLKAKNGREALDLLKKDKNYQKVDLILLDLMMPVMSGVDFMREHNNDPDLKHIPVIMQTAVGSRESILEGFDLGVYHYLVKPFLPDLFNSVVSSAIATYDKNRKLYSRLHNAMNLNKFVDHAVFKIKSLEDVDMISVSLAGLYPNPDKVVVGIFEILTNAVEHGNLGITYEEKKELKSQAKWRDEVKQRLTLPENASKSVVITFFKKENEIVLNVKDEGQGFEYQKYLDFSPARSTDSNGRGIAFANSISFDKLDYEGCGNEVNCRVRLQ